MEDGLEAKPTNTLAHVPCGRVRYDILLRLCLRFTYLKCPAQHPQKILLQFTQRTTTPDRLRVLCIFEKVTMEKVAARVAARVARRVATAPARATEGSASLCTGRSSKIRDRF